MAKSTSSQHRAQLIREMSKDMNRTRHSSGSSRHSQGHSSPEPTTSDFDPENEAIMSTRQLDNHSQQLPELRASAQKYSRLTRPAEPDFAINTSAIGRAFPDFSQGGSSSDGDSMSIEIGRGAKKGSNGTIGKLGRSREYSSNAQLSLGDDSMDFSAPMVGNYEVTTTPPLTQRQASKNASDGAHESSKRGEQGRRSSGLREEIFDPSPPPAKTKDYGSGESRKGSGQSRRTLAAIHARVRDEQDQSRIGDERPPTVDLTVKNTRFGSSSHPAPSSQAALPKTFSSAQTLLNSVAPTNKHKVQAIQTPNQGTQQSFMLPDLPNISELVSGVFEDGTPVFSRHGKSRASRFSATSQQNKQRGQDYVGVTEIPVPNDEQAIFLSLKLLQDKVAILEKNNAEATNTIDALQQKNKQLEEDKNQRRRLPRKDSALGTTDSDGDGVGGRKLLIEKNRLESSARTLQHQVDAANRKSATAETILQKISQERDAAVSQLGVAYVTIEQLKVENEALKEENNLLKGRMSQGGEEQIAEVQKGALEQRSDQRMPDETTAEKAKAEDPRMQKKRRQNRVSHREAQVLGSGEVQQRIQDAPLRKDANTIFDLSLQQDTKPKDREQERDSENDDSQDSEDSLHESFKQRSKGKAAAESYQGLQDHQPGQASQDLTYLSFLDNQEIAQLRRTLERERIERKQRQSRNHQPIGADQTATQTAPLGEQPEAHNKILPRKSSMKDVTSRSTIQHDAIENSLHAETQNENNRRHSDTSVLSTRSRRRGVDAGNMTSAFIVPDITIRNPAAKQQQIPKLTKEAQKAINDLAKHESQDCTVCRRVVNADEHHGNTTVKITKPVPVSQRVAEEEGDQTIRPSQTPSLALATVLKELEDELKHLKIQLVQFQNLFNGHDPALSKRRRKSVQQQMDTVVHAIDVKADQIYALYDVLEGQKQDGHELSEEEVEITLQSIRVKAPELQLRGGGDDETGNEKHPVERHPWDLESDGDDSDGLPWEGIESTVETTKSGFARARRGSGN